MNYSRATKHFKTRSQAIDEVVSQSIFELGRPLSKAEETSLFEKFSPQLVADRIHAVMIFTFHIFCITLFQYGYGTIKFLMLICGQSALKCDVSPSVTPKDGNCLLHGRY